MYPNKVSVDFVKKSFEQKSALKTYVDSVTKVGLWKSEELIFTKYFKKNSRIIDLGCGAGRTTLALNKLGYKNITGLDLTFAMVKNAMVLSQKYNYDIPFVLGDATSLCLKNKEYDGAVFSFNGMRQIPKRQNRVKAMKEINRVLKPESYFIFTTHLRYDSKELEEFWIQEEERWQNNKQDKRLYECGDLIVDLENEKRKSFIHIPTGEEIISCILDSGFKLIEDISRDDIAIENEAVNNFSKNCRFWVVKKL